MALSKLTISIYFLSVVLFVQMGAGDDPLQRLGIDCRKSNYFPAGAGSRYHKNLNILLSRLQSRTPETGFALEYVGNPKSDHRVYGRAFCRRDISSVDCRACIGAAIAWIFEKCPLKKRAVALYECCCVLIYTHKNIFHKIGDTTYYIYRTQNVTSPASVETITEFLDHLTVEAIATKTYFAKGEVKLAKSESTLYGLVQCASDISPADCKTCMGELMARIPDYTGKGGQFLSATCTLQYEFYRFFNA
ncbi:cysteine-rich repeat secretory protein 38-like [Coffea eugenioides]|uniref:cysteine-rich repeat secretory protein 38-like n=1 Tax=Coffea eugenioides TaxID=49369 RepID=UPI000F609AD1|nr:cysteine-rich repeat secretory protein 38-like [Coffea eugenioides]